MEKVKSQKIRLAEYLQANQDKWCTLGDMVEAFGLTNSKNTRQLVKSNIASARYHLEQLGYFVIPKRNAEGEFGMPRHSIIAYKIAIPEDIEYIKNELDKRYSRGKKVTKMFYRAWDNLKATNLLPPVYEDRRTLQITQMA